MVDSKENYKFDLGVEGLSKKKTPQVSLLYLNDINKKTKIKKKIISVEQVYYTKIYRPCLLQI